MCNALYSVGYSIIKNVCHKSTFDMDCILIAGNSLYSSLGFWSKLLSVDKLPSLIPIENILISITERNLETVLMTRSQREQFLQNSNQFNANSLGSGMIFIIGGLSSAVIWSENVFDSHRRDVNGFPSPIGISVLLKCGSVYKVQEYIREVRFIEAGNVSQYYQIQHLQAASPPIQVPIFILEALGGKRQRAVSIANNAQCSTKREQSQKRQRKRHLNLSEFEKNNIRHKNIVYLKSKRKKYSKEKAVARFKQEIKKSFLYLCSLQ